MINLLYAGNAGVFDGILTSALSVVMRMERPTALTVYILTMELTRLDGRYVPLEEMHRDLLEKVLKEKNPDTRVKLFDVTELYESELAYNANEGCYCSPYTLLRLLADLIPDIPDKLLYLDCDTMFNKNISLIWSIDVNEYEYAAARDHYGKFLLYPNYINAGVLLFNMKRCRETGIFARARELILKKKLLFADQSALIRSTTKRKLLSQRFNDQKFLYRDTVIRHFSKRLFYFPYPRIENVKQWQIARVREVFGYTAFNDIWNEYLRIKEEHKQ